MNTCKTCKHWGEELNRIESGYPRLHPQLHLCKQAIDITYFDVYKMMDIENDALSINIYSDISVVGHSPTGNLFTGPDFGCVKWELAPSPEGVHAVVIVPDGEVLVSAEMAEKEFVKAHPELALFADDVPNAEEPVVLECAQFGDTSGWRINTMRLVGN